MPKAPSISMIAPIKDKDCALSEISNTLGYGDKALCRLCSNLTKDREFMLKAIAIDPRAYLYAHSSIKDTEFKLSAVKTNGLVYALLSKKERNIPGMMDAHIEGIIKRGYIRAYPPHRDVDPRKYYSVEAYKRIYAELVLGAPRFTIHGYATGREWDDTPRVVFLKYALRINPEMAKQYEQARHDVLMDHADKIAELAYQYKADDWGNWVFEVRSYCPELEGTVLKAYREEHWQELMDRAKNTSGSYPVEYCTWLKRELDRHRQQYGDPNRGAQEVEAKTSEAALDKDDKTQQIPMGSVAMSVDEILKYIEENKDAVIEAIVDGKLSLETIANALGMEYDAVQEICGPTTPSDSINITDNTEEHERGRQ
jgi:hypothetical protein